MCIDCYHISNKSSGGNMKYHSRDKDLMSKPMIHQDSCGTPDNGMPIQTLHEPKAGVHISSTSEKHKSPSRIDRELSAFYHPKI